MSNYEQKSGHPVLGIILGILGIIAALFLCLLTGVIGGAIAGILGLAAVLTGMAARKGGKGIGVQELTDQFNLLKEKLDGNSAATAAPAE